MHYRSNQDVGLLQKSVGQFTFLLGCVVVFQLLHSNISFDVSCASKQGGFVGSWLCLSEQVTMVLSVKTAGLQFHLYQSKFGAIPEAPVLSW